MKARVLLLIALLAWGLGALWWTLAGFPAMVAAGREVAAFNFVAAARGPDHACGIGWVQPADSGDAFDFRDACLTHDHCYAQRSLDRPACDRLFFDDMVGYCFRTWDESDPRRARCEFRARIYYEASRLGGWLFW